MTLGGNMKRMPRRNIRAYFLLGLTLTMAGYNVTFPMFSKISVEGRNQNPLYAYLTKEANPSITGDIQWNFTKFLVDRSGHVVRRFESAVTPDSPQMIDSIEKLLKL